MSKRTRIMIAAAVVLNVTALVVLFWLVLDARMNRPQVTRTIYQSSDSGLRDYRIDQLIVDATRQASNLPCLSSVRGC